MKSSIVIFYRELYVYIVAPTQTAVAMYMLYQLLGNSIFASVAILLLATPISGLIGWAQRRIRLAIMKVKDERIKLINEALTSIKVSGVSYHPPLKLTPTQYCLSP